MNSDLLLHNLKIKLKRQTRAVEFHRVSSRYQADRNVYVLHI